jgi:hypothetical protein
LNTYLVVLVLHSWIRWLVLASAVGALVFLARGAVGKRPFGSSDSLALRLFLSAFDTQVLFGLLLYFLLSPLGLPRDIDMALVMKSSVLRYFALEHISGMLTALAIAHLGWVRARSGPMEKRRGRALWAVGLPLFIVLLTLPWPGTPYARDLFRL